MKLVVEKDYYVLKSKLVGVNSGVYFLLDESKGLVKIGYSSNIVNRVNTHLCSNPYLKYLGVLEAKDKMLEYSLHERYKKYREVREWFKWEGEIRDYVEELEKWK